MSAGTAVAVINYISQIFAPVENLGMEIQTIQSAIAGVHRINEFLSWMNSQLKRIHSSQRILRWKLTLMCLLTSTM